MKNNSLYFVTGQNASSGRATLQVVKEAISGGVDIVQMREKSMDKETLLSLGKELAGLCKENGVTFIVNDDPFLAKEIDADGVHLGQEDIIKYPVKKARHILGPGKIIGISTHSVEQFLAAENMDVDYIAYGPVFVTETKDYHIGVEEVEKVVEAATKPVIFIGGINLGNMSVLLEKGAKNIAVIRAISQADNIKETVLGLKKLLSQPEKMVIKINGTESEVSRASTLLGIINDKGLLPERIVVEYNREIIPADRLEDVVVKNDDSIEIVSFVGGG